MSWFDEAAVAVSQYGPAGRVDCPEGQCGARAGQPCRASDGSYAPLGLPHVKRANDGVRAAEWELTVAEQVAELASRPPRLAVNAATVDIGHVDYQRFLRDVESGLAADQERAA